MRDVSAGRTALVERTNKPRGKSIVEGGRGVAARTVGMLGGILSFAVSEGIIAANPVHGVKRPADQRKTTRLTPDTYRTLGQAIERVRVEGGSTTALNAIMLLLLTGCRKAEIENLQWAEVDAVGRAFRLKDSKEGASIRPIGSAAFAILQTVPAR
jgi:integrase